MEGVPYFISVEEALDIVKRTPLPRRVQEVKLNDSHGRILAEDLASKVDDPPFDNSSMDGFACKHDPDAQIIRGHHIEMRADGNRMRPWIVRYLTPEQLDASAAAVGFVRTNRWATWSGSPFNPSPPSGPDHPPTSSDVHVSVYQHPSG